MLTLKEKYEKNAAPEMMKKFGHKNKMAVPKIEKVILNMGVGKRISGMGGKEREKILAPILENLALITGQKSVLTKSHRSISGFKVRAGAIVGIKTTLRGAKANDFLERLINIALPRSRDFRGIEEKAVDKQGNLTIGIKEHIIFPEVSTERAQDILSFQITVKTTTNDREQGLELLRLLGFPIKINKSQIPNPNEIPSIKFQTEEIFKCL